MTPELEQAFETILAGARAGDLESETLEFKEEGPNAKNTMTVVAGAAACLANTRGGYVVLGIRDKGAGPGAFVGTELDPLAVKESIYARTVPPLLVDVRRHELAVVTLVIVSVPAGVDLHADTNGRIEHRVGTSCVYMPPELQQQRRDERSGQDYSDERSSAPPETVTPEAMTLVRRRLSAEAVEDSPLAGGSDAALLRYLGLVDGEGRLLRAGEILCGDIGREWAVYQYSISPGGEARHVERLTGPLISVFDRLVDLAWNRRTTTPLTMPDATLIEIADYPIAAVREALANALLHRDLRIDRPVTVLHSPTSFVVESPGRFVPGVTEQNIITHPSKPRNQRLFTAARRLGLAEDTGLGVDRIFREMLLAGKGAPSITETLDSVRVAFIGGPPRMEVVQFLERLEPSERNDVDALLTVFKLLDSRTTSAKRLAPVIQKPPVEAAAVLERLASDSLGILEATSESRNRRKPTFRLRSEVVDALGSAVRYRTQSYELDDIDRKVVTHLRDYGRINNRTVRDLFNVDVHRASVILRGLRERGIVVRGTAQQRGPGVVYEPGPSFPRQ